MEERPLAMIPRDWPSVFFKFFIMDLKSLSSLMRARCFWMFSASRRISCAMSESLPAYLRFNARYEFFFSNSKSMFSSLPVSSLRRVCSD